MGADQPDAERRDDRRVRRTRAALREAIVALCLDKGFHAITGDDIADHADVARATFYTHYQNKDDLLNDVVDDFTTRVIASFDGARSGRFERLLDQVVATPDVCRLMLRGEGDGLALRRFTAAVEGVIDDDYDDQTQRRRDDGVDLTPTVERELAVTMRAGAIVAAVRWFLAQPDANAADIAERVLAVLQPSWESSLGVPNPSS